MLKETLVVAIGEFGRSPRIGVSTSGNSNAPDGRDHWPYCYSAVVAGCGHRARRAVRRIRPDRLVARRTSRCTRTTCWPRRTTRSASTRTWWCCNHLNQPRELVKGKIVADLWS